MRALLSSSAAATGRSSSNAVSVAALLTIAATLGGGSACSANEASDGAIAPDTFAGARATAEPERAGGTTECPPGMTLVEGNYCPEVEHTCLKWLDPPGTPYAQFRCQKYQAPAKCKGEKRPMRYCIDIHERREEGSPLPAHFVSYNDASSACARDGARICKESEWEFACEGEEMRPYPYGWERNGALCNAERTTDLGRIGALVDHRVVSGSLPGCKSPFGIFDQAGNVEEWVKPDAPKMGFKQVMKGSWWIPSRHACRSFQVGHGPEYGGGESGYRCCKDAASILASHSSRDDATRRE